MKTKTIKNVDEETWRNFKMMSVKAEVSMAFLLRMMLKEFEKSNRKVWMFILNKKRLLSDKEAEDILKISKKLRKEKGFRE